MRRQKPPSSNASKKSKKGPKSVISETASDVQSVREDCQALGIDIDEEVLERMQRLGIQRTWETTSRLATSLKSRNPIAHTSTVDHRNFNEPLMITESLLKEWTYELAQPDPKVVAQSLRSIYDKENFSFPTSLRLEVQRILQILKIQYGRSPDKFVKGMLTHKATKDNNSQSTIRTGQLVRNSFVDMNQFRVVLSRLHPSITADHASLLFSVLHRDIEVQGENKRLVDLRSFVLMLRLANESTRRSFDCKSSPIATSVEFWREQNCFTPSSHPSINGHITSKNIIYSQIHSKDLNEALGLTPHNCTAALLATEPSPMSVAELLGREERASTSQSKQGRFIFGTLHREAYGNESTTQELARLVLSRK